jgi:hypothetical protein
VRRGDQTVVRFQDFGFSAEHQHDRAARVADIEGFVILVENLDSFVHARNCSRRREEYHRPRTRQLSERSSSSDSHSDAPDGTTVIRPTTRRD